MQTVCTRTTSNHNNNSAATLIFIFLHIVISKSNETFTRIITIFSVFLSIADGHFSGCGINDEVSQWMDGIQNGATENDENDDEKRKAKTPKKYANAPGTAKRNKSREDKEFFTDDLTYPHIKYTKEANLKDRSTTTMNDDDDGDGGEDDDGEEWHRRSHARAKRAARPKEENRNTCSLYIQTDPLIWRHIREGIADVSRTALFR